MRKSFLFILALCILTVNTLDAQKGSLLKKVGKSMTDELIGKPADTGSGTKSVSTEPEPGCSCDKPELIMDLGGKLKLDYRELSINVMDDGSILAKQRGSEEYYIVKNGVTQGPIAANDPRVAAFEAYDKDSQSTESLLLMYKSYISRSGDKFIINFGGKTYGPYAQIANFAISRSKEKFAATVVENIIVTGNQGKKMDEAIKNAKTDQEKMDLAMKYSAEMQQNIMQAGGIESTTPKIVTNVPDASFDPTKAMGGTLNGNVKYDDIVIIAYDKVIDLHDKTLISLKQDDIGASEMFINSANTKYAVYSYGELKFSDGTSLSELFNPYLVKVNGQVYLAYMYYSPKRNSIMQCKIPF
jgi:hypothetical protein